MKRLLAHVCALALALVPGLSFAAPPSVDAGAVTTGFSDTGSGTTVSYTAPGPNRTIVVPVCAEYNGSGLTVNSVTGPGLTFTRRLAAAPGSGFTATYEVWTAPAASTFSGAIQVIVSATVDDAVFGVFSVAGLNSISSPFDSNGSVPAATTNTTGGSAPTAPAISTSEANDLLLSASCGNQGFESTTGWTQLFNDARGPGTKILFAHMSLATTTVTATQSSLSIPFGGSGGNTVQVLYADAMTGDSTGGGSTVKAQSLALFGVQ